MLPPRNSSPNTARNPWRKWPKCISVPRCGRKDCPSRRKWNGGDDPAEFIFLKLFQDSHFALAGLVPQWKGIQLSEGARDRGAKGQLGWLIGGGTPKNF